MKTKREFRVAVILGSIRGESNTRKAAKIAIEEFEKHPEFIVDVIDPSDLDLPFPAAKSSSTDPKKIQAIVEKATGVVLATPEYHGTYSSILKLIIENLGYPSKLSGKPIVLLGVASGDIGAIKSIESLRGVCAHVGGFILPGSVSIPKVESHFNEKGECITPKIEKRIQSVSQNLMNYIKEKICPKLALEEIVREQKC